MEANIDFVTERIAIGGDLDTERTEVARTQLDGLVEAGITHIVDCRGEWSDEDFVARWAPGIEYLHNGTHDNGGAQSSAFFDRGVAFAREALEQEDTGVLVHCHMGINRGPSMGFAVLLDQGWDQIEALDAIRAARPIAAVSYAEDALFRHLGSVGVDRSEIDRETCRLREWQELNPIDVVRIIRGIRIGEQAA